MIYVAILFLSDEFFIKSSRNGVRGQGGIDQGIVFRNPKSGLSGVVLFLLVFYFFSDTVTTREQSCVLVSPNILYIVKVMQKNDFGNSSQSPQILCKKKFLRELIFDIFV